MIHGIMLVRNEEGRYLERVLGQMRSVCDRLIVLDDASTDNTADICTEYADSTVIEPQSYWETDELRLRKRLWELATEQAQEGDWILCLDADETLDCPELLHDYIKKADAAGCNSLAFTLYDMWNETHYRDDCCWQAHNGVWPFCVKFEDIDYFWKETPLHCGRFPMNAVNRTASCPIRIQHWGWSRPEDRQSKYERYMRSDPEGKYGCLEQYQSILDPDPVLRRFENV